MSTQRDVEQLLMRIPLSTPADESRAGDMLQTFVSLRNHHDTLGGSARAILTATTVDIMMSP